MTIRSLGRQAPIHIDMLRLAGYAEVPRERDLGVTNRDEDFLQAMRDGRAALCEQTGRDFGYDLAAWRKFLLAAPEDEFGYRHPYAFKGVDRAVKEAIRSRRRRELVAGLEEGA